MDLVKFWTVCSLNGIILDDMQMTLFERYHRELLYWNEKINLISRRDSENLLQRHILHSLTILKYVNFQQKAKCIDIGTGAGLPGIPLKIARPDIYMLLVDSIAKKINLTKGFAQHTELKNISAIRARAEDLAEETAHYKKYDFIVSRAVASAAKILGWCRGLLKPGGRIVLLKGGELIKEMSEAKNFFPNIDFTEHKIDISGDDWFSKEEKKIIEIRLD
jgi:16S rRNA (guanine527-N7)-methyltransferase